MAANDTLLHNEKDERVVAAVWGRRTETQPAKSFGLQQDQTSRRSQTAAA